MTTNTTTAQVRTFVAIELPESVIAVLAAMQKQLTEGKLPLRLTAPAGMHLTLAFIGEIPQTRVDDLVEAVQRGCAGIAPFGLRAEGIGMFPNANAPRVVWAGVQGMPAAMAALTNLRARIVRELAVTAFAVDRRFDPHLTLGRVPDRATSDDRARVGAAVQAQPPLGPFAFPVSEVSVMRSELRAGGSVYTRIADVALRAGG
ncbi:MAG: RNA 2',3'-cyclic phosphodiesterase [Chloroflexia bacterium]